MSKSITILAIESSCDETAASVIINGQIHSNFIANQLVHEKYGGVVPELASRAHMENIVPVVDEALKKAFPDVSHAGRLSALDAIAFTQAPGLIGSLLVGAQFAKSLALSLQKPLIAVHHMQAHVVANLIDEPRPSFPFLCLTVSGGHTQIVQCNSPSDLIIIGQTIDDGDSGVGRKLFNFVLAKGADHHQVDHATDDARTVLDGFGSAQLTIACCEVND